MVTTYDRQRRLADRIARVTGISRTHNAQLMTAAQLRARQGPHPEGHVSPILDGLAAIGWGWGEVLGYNRFQLRPIPAVVDAWMASLGHRRIITDPSYRHIGTGVWLDRSVWPRRWYFVAIVGVR